MGRNLQTLLSVGIASALAGCSFSSSLHAGGLLGGSSGAGGDSGSSSASTSSSGGSGHATGVQPESTPAWWKKFAVRGIELGSPRSALVAKGFTCGKRANSRCYKLMDKRCETGLCEFKEDAFGQWFELNGAKTDLDFMTCGTTESDAALVYSIRLYFGPRQLLALDSTLGKALVGKYGPPASHADPDEPSDVVGGGRMSWRNEELGSKAPEIDADCNGKDKKQCSLTVEDYGLIDLERARQAVIDKKKMHDSQPATAPQL